MFRLIQNEFYKIYRRKFLFAAFILIFVCCAGYTIYIYVNVDQRSDMDVVQEQLEREKEYFAQIESVQWETDLEMQSAILASQATIDRLQYMLDNDIASWDWRSDVLSAYYTNLNILSILNNGQDPADYGFDIGTYDSTETAIQRYESLCEMQLAMVEENDYMAYSQQNYAMLQVDYADNADSMTQLEAAQTEIEIETWKLYMQYETPPGSQDQWKSVAITLMQEEKSTLASLQYDESVYGDMTEDELSRAKKQAQRQIRIYEYALENDTIPLTIYESMAEDSGVITCTDFMISIKLIMKVVLVLSIIVAAYLMADEFRGGTIQQLVLYPYTRNQIAMAKLFTVLLMSLCMSLIIPVFGTVVGRALFGNLTIGQSLKSSMFPSQLSLIHNKVYEIPFVVFLLLHYGFEWMQIAVFSIITLSVTSFVKATVLPMVLMIFLSLSGQQIISMVYTDVTQAGILKYLLLGNTDLIRYFTGTQTAPYASFTVSVICIVVYTTLFLLLYFINFKHQEIIIR